MRVTVAPHLCLPRSLQDWPRARRPVGLLPSLLAPARPAPPARLTSARLRGPRRWVRRTRCLSRSAPVAASSRARAAWLSARQRGRRAGKSGPAPAPPRGRSHRPFPGPFPASQPQAPPRPLRDALAEPWEGPGRSPPRRRLGGPAPLPRPPRAGWPWAGAFGGPRGSQGVPVCPWFAPGRCRPVEALLRYAPASLEVPSPAPGSWGSGGGRHIGLGRLVGWLWPDPRPEFSSSFSQRGPEQVECG